MWNKISTICFCLALPLLIIGGLLWELMEWADEKNMRKLDADSTTNLNRGQGPTEKAP
jgi:hypothetical protein